MQTARRPSAYNAYSDARRRVLPGPSGGLCFSVEMHRFTGPDPDIARDAADEILAESWVGGSLSSACACVFSVFAC